MFLDMPWTHWLLLILFIKCKSLKSSPKYWYLVFDLPAEEAGVAEEVDEEAGEAAGVEAGLSRSWSPWKSVH